MWTIWRLACGSRFSQKIKLASAETYEGEDGGIAYMELELPAEDGTPRIWKAEQGFRCFLRMWNAW